MTITPTLAVTPAIRAMLDPAVKAGGHDWSELEARLSEGRACLWLAGDSGCVLTQVDAEDVCDVALGGGRDAHSWVGAMEAAIRAHPAHAEVQRYRIWGRGGWRRLFPHWRFVGVEDGLAVLESDAS
jgi:hypothetical protein